MELLIGKNMSVLDGQDIYETFLTDDIIESVGFRPKRNISTGARIPGSFLSLIPIIIDPKMIPGCGHISGHRHEWIVVQNIKYDNDTYSLFEDYDHTYKIFMQNNVSWTEESINKSLGYPKLISTIGELIEETHKIYKFIEDNGLTIPQNAKLFS